MLDEGRIEYIRALDHHVEVDADVGNVGKAYIWAVGIVQFEDEERVVLKNGGTYFEDDDGKTEDDQTDIMTILKGHIIERVVLAPKTRKRTTRRKKR